MKAPCIANSPYSQSKDSIAQLFLAADAVIDY